MASIFLDTTRDLGYSKSPTYEWVLSQEHIHKPNLFISPTKLAYTISYIFLYCNRFIILFTQITHKKQTQKIKETFLILQFSTLKSTVVRYNSWHTATRSYLWMFATGRFICTGLAVYPVPNVEWTIPPRNSDSEYNYTHLYWTVIASRLFQSTVFGNNVVLKNIIIREWNNVLVLWFQI